MPPLITILTLPSLFTLAAATSPALCGWGLPRNPLTHLPLCPDPFLPSSPPTWTPWTHPPYCLPRSPSSSSPPSLPYCVYTNAALPPHSHPPSGISIITTPDLASSIFDLTTRPLTSAYTSLPAQNLSHISPRPLEIRPVQGKGLGVFATREIPKGKVVMVDWAMLLAPEEYPAEVGQGEVRELLAVVGERAEGIRGLARSGREGLSVEEDVVVTNGFELPVVVRAVGEEGEERMEERGYLGVFPELSRVNHACHPNAHVHFSETTMAMTVWSAKDIKSGEEITISYSSIELTSEERKQTLKSIWGFDCTCSLCTAPKAVLDASDARRREFRAARDEILKLVQSEDFKGAADTTERLFKIVDEEELGPHFRGLHEVPARLYYQLGDLETAKRYFERSMWELRGLGVPGQKDVASLQNAEKILARLEEEIEEKRTKK